LAERVQRQQAALLEIGREWRRYQTDVELAIRAITETAVTALDVERASVWLLDDAGERLLCEDLYERRAQRHSKGLELRAEQYPSYFAALRSNEVIAASDAQSDARTREFCSSYLKPLGIGAMLDAPVHSSRGVLGVLCHEHVGAPREFPVDEQNTANHLAHLVSLALAFRQRRSAESELAASVSLLRTTMESIGEAILAVDRRGSVVTYNQQLIELWQLPLALLGPAGDGGPRLRHIAEQTTQPEEFLRRARAIFNEPESEFTELIELRDGRSVERTSRPHRLESEVIGRVWSYRDVTHLRQMEAALRESEARLLELASRDALTGLFNRRTLSEQLQHEVARGRRSGREFSVAMLDLDYFKRINDTFGHQTGDLVLQAFSHDLTHRLRKTDVIGRWGGEEFLLILPETKRDQAFDLLDGIREHVARERTVVPSFTISAGIAEFPADGTDVQALVAVADARMYEAKRTGRNLVV